MPTATTSPKDMKAVIAGSTVGSVLVILGIIAALFLVRRCRRQREVGGGQCFADIEVTPSPFFMPPREAEVEGGLIYTKGKKRNGTSPPSESQPPQNLCSVLTADLVRALNERL
ncbi:hypothetical protein L218DRAFT_964422 [Marasmius fiardii PR-910]|nr:hypothetical protein L218DRAFT_964422 [Marasmius fiardii PR-910]